MGTIAEELQILAANKAAIKAAIQGKNPSTPPGDDMSNWATSIESIPSGSGGGGGSVPPNDVVFRDYDGTILYSYSASEVASLTSLPPLPTREGLTCQEWNWTLPQIKSYVVSYGKCEIGATYTTDDGKTRIKLTIQDPKYTTIPIVFQQTVANGVDIDWGDGSQVQTYSSTSQQTISHAYSPVSYPATYTVTFKVNSGTMSFPTYIMGKSNNTTDIAWNSMIDEVNIGNNVTSINKFVFRFCYSLKLITISLSVTSINNYAFSGCRSITCIVIPSSITSIAEYLFSYCYSLSYVMIPNSITRISSQSFYYCYPLTSIIIPNSIEYNGIGSAAFSRCSSLTNITIPNSVSHISSYMLEDCNSLTNITIPNSVNAILGSAFLRCYGLKTFDFRRVRSVPTLNNKDAFASTPESREIIVPDSLYDEWVGSSNWVSTTYNIRDSIVKASESSLGPYYETRYKYVGESTWNVASIYGELTSSSIPNIEQVSEVEIGNGVTSIGANAFYNCSGLTSVTFLGKTPSQVQAMDNYPWGI